MQPRDVRKLVEDAIGDDWAATNHHHVDLRRALVQPRKITIIERPVRNGKLQDRTVVVWLVLVERADQDQGYRIVMKENQLADRRIERQRDRGAERAVPPSDVRLVFFMSHQ